MAERSAQAGPAGRTASGAQTGPAARVDRVFAALSSPVRRAILAQLSRGECSVTELGAPFDLSPPAISKHIKALEACGLLRRRVQGRVHRCQLDPVPLEEAAEWLEHFKPHWEERFDLLTSLLTPPGPGGQA